MSNDAGDISEAMNCVNASDDEVQIQGRNCNYVHEMTISINCGSRERQSETDRLRYGQRRSQRA